MKPNLKLIVARTMLHKTMMSTTHREARILASEMADQYRTRVFVYLLPGGQYVSICESEIDRSKLPLEDHNIIEMYE